MTHQKAIRKVKIQRKLNISKIDAEEKKEHKRRESEKEQELKSFNERRTMKYDRVLSPPPHSNPF